MINHTDRDHALLSASGASRWMSCTASPLLEDTLPDNATEAAAEGTLAHELCELTLRNYFYPKELSKRKYNSEVKKLKENELWSDEMLRHAETYLDIIKNESIGMPNKPFVLIEKRVDFSKWVPGGFGTADCMMVSGDTLYVIDFKYGKGVPVSAENNPQMQLYGLGAYQACNMLYDTKKIKMMIIQPRLFSEPSTWETDLFSLLKFGELAREKATEAMEGGKFNPSAEGCKFCRARAMCKARAEMNVKLAFMKDTDPKTIGNDEIGKYLKAGEDVAGWVSDLKEYALKLCLNGQDVKGYKAVEGRGSRKWADEKKAFAILEASNDKEKLYEVKPLSIAKLEKSLGKTEVAACVGDYIVKAPGKPTLVEETDKRQAITLVASAEDAFGKDE